MIRVGVVGLGVMGQHHARVYSELDCRLTAVADIDGGRAQQTADKYRTSGYADYRELFGKVDAVSLAVPTAMHSRLACEFLEHGIHCLVEKPVAASKAEAEAMAEAASRMHLKLMVGHIERFNPAVTKLKQMIEDDELGRLVTISTRRVGPFVPRMKELGIVLDSAIHDIDVAAYLVDRAPTAIYSKLVETGNGIQDNAMIVLDFGATIVSIEVNWLSPVKSRTLIASGTKGVCHLDYMKQELIFNGGTDIHQIETSKGEPLRIELTKFLESIQNDTLPPMEIEDAMMALKIAELAVNSSGGTVKYP